MGGGGGGGNSIVLWRGGGDCVHFCACVSEACCMFAPRPSQLQCSSRKFLGPLQVSSVSFGAASLHSLATFASGETPNPKPQTPTPNPNPKTSNPKPQTSNLKPPTPNPQPQLQTSTPTSNDSAARTTPSCKSYRLRQATYKPPTSYQPPT